MALASLATQTVVRCTAAGISGKTTVSDAATNAKQAIVVWLRIGFAIYYEYRG
jgi:hypothetical protein